MKKLIGFLYLVCFATLANAQTAQNNTTQDAPADKIQVVEASCGECHFGMKVPKCVLAVRIDGKPYLVEGAKTLDSYGEAHGKEGMCTVIRKAEVTGEIKNDKFVATSFKLLPVEKPKEQ